MLLLHLLLPLNALAGQRQHARLSQLRALQTRRLRFDQVLQPVLDALDLFVLGLHLRRQRSAIPRFKRHGLQHRRLLQLLARCLIKLAIGLHLGVAAARASLGAGALLRPLHRYLHDRASAINAAIPYRLSLRPCLTLAPLLWARPSW